MKFPKTHHERILETIRSNDYSMEEFYLVKRKGWIRIEFQGSGDYFTYFKKKETLINPESKQWEFNTLFKIRIKGIPEKQKPTFDTLMEEFDNWLRSLRLKEDQ